MIALLTQRFLGLIVTLIAVSLLIFAVMAILPGDPASIMLGTSASPETLAALRHEMGLDRPLVVQYGTYLLQLATGNLGISYRFSRPALGVVIDELREERLEALAVQAAALNGPSPEPVVVQETTT